MTERIAIINGLRTPFAKAEGALKYISADNLAAPVFKEVVIQAGLKPSDIDEVILGNVAQPANAANISRVVALKSGLPNEVSAFTVHRNCASGMEALSTAVGRLLTDEADIVLAGGTESMSQIPLLYGPKMTAFFSKLSRAKTPLQKLNVLISFRLHFLKPVIGVMEGLTDPVCGLIMGLTAENLAKEFKITREEQDQFALESHLKALAAQEKGIFNDEIHPVSLPPKMNRMLHEDLGPRKGQTLEALAKLRPYFDKSGTVTVGNACPLTDGAAAMVLMKERKAKAMGLTPLGYIKGYAYAGLEPHRMGLGPVYATSKVMDKLGMSMSDFELVELNEAFAVQVLACQRAFESAEFAKRYLGKNKALGELKSEILNVNGGAIALGHPVGTTGTRLVLTLLKEMHRRNLKTGLATLCIGGGQGGAMVVETK